MVVVVVVVVVVDAVVVSVLAVVLAVVVVVDVSLLLGFYSFLPRSRSLSVSSSPRLKGRVRPPGHQGQPAFYGLLLLEGSEVK